MARDSLRRTTLHCGDCREVMATFEADSIDAIVSDPPYGLEFMGKGWDRGVPGPEFWTEALRVAKPGAHLLAFGGTRTFHRLACAIEDAGWEIRDCVMWVYGSGFPKSHNIGKAIDKMAGAEREIVGRRARVDGAHRNYDAWRPHRTGSMAGTLAEAGSWETAPATEAARRWEGWGTALKPAWEPIIVARKPFAGTVAANVLEHGTGAINVDGCRVHMSEADREAARVPNRVLKSGIVDAGRGGHVRNGQTFEPAAGGRWPANLILTYPEDRYMLKEDVTPSQLLKLAEWMNENAKR